MNNETIGFIGGGNMAISLIGGLIADGMVAERLLVAEPDSARRAEITRRFGVHTTDNNLELANQCEVVVLAVKPQLMREVCKALAEELTAQPLFVSIAAGVRMADIERWLGGERALVRSMPNTPALIQTGATALVANRLVSETQRESAESVLRAVGLTLWLEQEQQLDIVTALSGSGPAYFFYIIELLQKSAEALGLAPKVARLLALQTAFGASKMALESEEGCDILRQRVTSPGGTTERALQVLQQQELGATLAAAVTAARDRAEALAQELGGR
ncbi:pyrroline-5-carboxylate reductase [Ectothiorhodospiraceae bacterium BW-2]|nr:pyrroline-5-carboxylate reductase [Ectothiorhodospiraceae bacterium BW-2]